MKFSSSFKIIASFLLILLVGVIASVYDIDINKYLSNFSNKISNTSTSSKAIEVSLIECIDGDTVKFKENNAIYTYRLLGIDTPELNTNQKYSKEALNYTCNSLKNANKITIKYENTSTHIDKYKRRLVWVFVDDILIQEKLLENGYAKVRYAYTKLTYLDKLYKAQSKTQDNKKNIYKDYKKKLYDIRDHTVIFKTTEKSEYNLKMGEIVTIPNNPEKEGFTFEGWGIDGKLYDLSNPVTANLILTPIFSKNT